MKSKIGGLLTALALKGLVNYMGAPSQVSGGFTQGQDTTWASMEPFKGPVDYETYGYESPYFPITNTTFTPNPPVDVSFFNKIGGGYANKIPVGPTQGQDLLKGIGQLGTSLYGTGSDLISNLVRTLFGGK